MEERHVVTIFLKHGDRIALFRRSRAVGTYQGRWAGISGFVESGYRPEVQAWKELKEETGLTAEDVWLERQGAPLEVVDPDLDRKWVVHPFLLEVKDASGIRLDWEHSEMKWVAPEEIAAHPTVPRLWETWLRVASPGPQSRREEA